MLYSLSFMANGLLSFALVLILPHILPASEFGLLSLLMVSGFLFYAVLFEWLRICVLRFTNNPSQRVMNARNKSIQNIYFILGVLTFIIFCMVAAYMHDVAIIVVGVFIISQGWFDYHMARTRAQFLRGAFSRLLITRACLSFAVSIAIAYVTENGVLTILGVVAANIIAGALQRYPDLGATKPRTYPAFIKRCAVYGLPLVIGAASAIIAPFLFRAAIASDLGMENVGQFSLPFDTVQRIMTFIAMSFNIVSFQNLIRDYPGLNRRDFQIKTGHAASMIAMFVIPALIGFWAVGPYFSALFIPDDFQTYFNALLPIALITIGFYIAKSFMIDVVLMVIHETRALALSALVIFLISFLWITNIHEPTLAHYAYGLLTAQGSAFILSVIWLWAKGHSPIMFNHLWRIVISAVIMLGVLMVIPDISNPLWALGINVSAGIAVYGAMIWALNPLAIRTQIKQLAKSTI